MPDTDKQPPWWRELFRKEEVGGHIVSALVGLAVTFVVGLFVTAFWLTVAAWHGSYLWTQRMVGAMMAFSVFILQVAIALALLRRRIIKPTAQPVDTKGYLDYKADSSKSTADITRIMTEITAITVDETKKVSAGTERLKRIYRSPSSDKRLRKELAESERSARSSDKTTKKLAKFVVPFATATYTYAQSELACCRFLIDQNLITAQEALFRTRSAQAQLISVNDYLRAQAEGQAATVARRGFSRVVNEAVDRRVNVVDRLCAAMALQQDPLHEIISLLEPFLKESSEHNPGGPNPDSGPSETIQGT